MVGAAKKHEQEKHDVHMDLEIFPASTYSFKRRRVIALGFRPAAFFPYWVDMDTLKQRDTHNSHSLLVFKPLYGVLSGCHVVDISTSLTHTSVDFHLARNTAHTREQGEFFLNPTSLLSCPVLNFTESHITNDWVNKRAQKQGHPY